MAQGTQPAQVVTADKSIITARRGVVVAVEGPEAQRMMGLNMEVRVERGGSCVVAVDV